MASLGWKTNENNEWNVMMIIWMVNFLLASIQCQISVLQAKPFYRYGYPPPCGCLEDASALYFLVNKKRKIISPLLDQQWEGRKEGERCASLSSWAHGQECFSYH